GYKYEKLIQHDNREIELVFENGMTVMTGLVIGADGAFSKIRPYLTDAKPTYTGISMIEMNSNEKEHPDLLAFIDNGKVMGVGRDKAILEQRNGDGRIMAYVSHKKTNEMLYEYGALLLEKEKERPLVELSDWGTDLKNILHTVM